MSFLTKRGTTPKNEEYLKSIGYVNVESMNSGVSVWRSLYFHNLPFYEIVVVPGERVVDIRTFVEKIAKDEYRRGAREKEKEINERLQQRAKEFINSII